MQVFKKFRHLKDAYLQCVRMAYLKKAKLIQKAAQVSNDLRSGDKLLPHRVIKNQIQVSLSESCFLMHKDKTNRPSSSNAFHD